MPVLGRVAVRRRYIAYFDGLGVLTFIASPDHASLTDYTVRVYALGTTSPVVTSRSLGVPTPDSNNEIRHDLTSMLNPLTAGNYTVTVLATSPTGSAETSGVNFSLPLAG